MVVQNLYEFDLRNYYDGLMDNKSFDLYEAYDYYTSNGGQDTPVLLELWRRYLNSLGYYNLPIKSLRENWIFDNAVWAWDSVSNRYRIRGKDATQSESLSLSSSAGFARNFDSSWSSYSANSLRNTDVGTTLEKSITNLLSFTTDLTNSVWVKGSGVVITPTAEASQLFGNWSKVSKGAVASNTVFLSQIFNISPLQSYTGSITIKGEGSNIGKLVDIVFSRDASGGGSFSGTSTQVQLTAEPKTISLEFTSVASNTKGLFALRVPTSNPADEVVVVSPFVGQGRGFVTPVETSRVEDSLSLKLPSTEDLKIKFSEKGPAIGANRVVYDGVTQILDKAERPGIIRRLYPEVDVGLGGFRFELKSGDEAPVDVGTGKERAEIAVVSTDAPKSTNLWSAFALKVLSGSVGVQDLATSQFTILWQSKGPSSSTRSPYASIHLNGSQLVIDRRRWTGTGLSVVSEVLIPDFQFDRYYQFVIKLKVDQTNGELSIWSDGVQIYNYIGQFGYWDESNAGHSKAGIYRSPQPGTTTTIMQNIERLTTTDLSGRIISPLPIDLPNQVIQSASPTNGVFVLNSSTLKHSIVESISTKSI